jgi:hypothetical protein
VLYPDDSTPRSCDFAVVRATTRALSGVIRVDFCNTDDTPPLICESSATTALQRGDAIGQVVLDLVNSYHDIAQHSEIVDRIRDLTPKLTSPFVTELGEPDGFAIQISHDTGNRFFWNYNCVKRDLRSVIDLAVAGINEASAMIRVEVENACEGPTPRCTSSKPRLYQRLLGGWFSQSSEESLLSKLTNSTAALDLELAALYHTTHDIGVHGNFSDDINWVLRRLLRGPYWDLKDDEVREVEQLSLEVSRLAVSIDEMNQQSLRLESRFLHLKRFMEQCGCLGLPQEGRRQKGMRRKGRAWEERRESIWLTDNSMKTRRKWEMIR